MQTFFERNSTLLPIRHVQFQYTALPHTKITVQPLARLGYHRAMETTQDRTDDTLEVGEALRRVAMLLDIIEQSGKDFDTLTAPELDERTWEELRERAHDRETWNPHVFEGETEAFDRLREVENGEIRAEAHKQILFYQRRAKTSGRIASALHHSYEQAEFHERCGKGSIDYSDYKKKLKELLGVVHALTEEHEQIVTLAQDAQLGDHECVMRRYEEQVAPLLEAFDDTCQRYRSTAKVHFKKRKALSSELKSRLARIDETNKVFEHYSFMEFHTRSMPEA